VEAKFEAQKIVFGPFMFQAAKTLRDTGILEAVAKNGSAGISSSAVAEDLKITKYGVEVLLDAGLSMGMVRLENNKYILTKTGFFILTDTLTRVNMDFVHDVCYQPMFFLKEAIRESKPIGLKVFGDWDTIYQGLTSLPDQVKKSWYDFDHYYSDLVFPEILPLVFRDHPAKIMDVGGNTGKWALKCAGFDPKVMITIVDLPGQLKQAMENARQQGFSKRIDGFEMNMLDKNHPFPFGYDVIWMSQFLDCFSEEEIFSILTRARAAMNEDTLLYILELFWDRQKYEASMYSLNAISLYFTVLANGNSRMYHSDDMIRLIHQVGLKIEEIHDNLGISHTLLRCRKQ
jgi:hypothetical protein